VSLRRLALVLALASSATGGATAAPLDVALGVRVIAATPGANAALKDDLEFEILNALARRDCVRAAEVVGAEDSGHDLRLEVAIVEVEDETRNDLSIAQRTRESDPDDRLRVEIFYALQLQWRLLDGTDASELDAGTFRASHLRRPLTHMEDPHEEARRRAIEEAARKAARPVCSLTVRRLEKLRRRR